MSKLAGVKKILDHCDREEILAKLILGIDINDIHDWLVAKYSGVGDKKLIISAPALKSFKDNYLDVYNMIQQDIQATKQAIANNTENELELAIKDNPTYKSKMQELAGKEIDIRQIVVRMCSALETRFEIIFDEIMTDPRNINTRIDRVLIEYSDALGSMLERYYKFTEESPDITINNTNISVQVIDSHIEALSAAIKETLSEMDLESSMIFMEKLAPKLLKLKAPTAEVPLNTDMKLAEVKLLNETINTKLNS